MTPPSGTPVCLIEKTSGARVAVDTRTLPIAYTAAPYYMERVTREREGDYAVESSNGDPWYDQYLLAWPGPSEVLQRSIDVDPLHQLRRAANHRLVA